MVVERRYCRFASIVAVAGGLFSTVTTAAGMARPENFGDCLFLAFVLGWACAPYAAVAVSCRFTGRPEWRSALSWGLLGYAIFDGALRLQALHFPTGSTDVLVVLFLPAWSPWLVVPVGGASALLRWVVHRRTQRQLEKTLGQEKKP